MTYISGTARNSGKVREPLNRTSSVCNRFSSRPNSMPTNQLMMFQPPVQQAELPPSQSQMDQSGINCGFPFKHAPAASSSSNANCGFPSKNTSSNANCGFPSKPPNLNSQEGQTVHGSLSLSEMRVPAPAAVKPVTMTSSLSSSNVMNSIAPPPTAFQDNNFYLTETQPANNAAHSSSGKRNSKNFYHPTNISAKLVKWTIHTICR